MPQKSELLMGLEEGP